MDQQCSAGPLRPLVADHTAAASRSGTVSCSGSYSSDYAPWNAFSSNAGMWISHVNEDPAWIRYDFTNDNRVVRGYRFLFANGSGLVTRAPKKFELQVKREDSWETVDSRCCEVEWAGTEERHYYLASEVEGESFRFLFLEDNDARAPIVVISLKNIQLL